MSETNTDRKNLVRERLEFVSIITSINTQFLDPSLTRITENNGWTHPWKYFDALRNYLLLTCFDLLGQSDGFKDFQSWLNSSRTISERNVALEKAENSSLLESVRSVHADYLSVYGAKNSFKRFINEVLPSDVKEQLLFSVMIRKIDTIKNCEIGGIDEESKKIDFLYAMRNAFTHEGVNIGSPAGGVFPNHGAWINMDGVLKKGYEPIYWTQKSHIRIEHMVRDWPDVLIRTVNAGLANA